MWDLDFKITEFLGLPRACATIDHARFKTVQIFAPVVEACLEEAFVGQADVPDEDTIGATVGDRMVDGDLATLMTADHGVPGGLESLRINRLAILTTELIWADVDGVRAKVIARDHLEESFGSFELLVLSDEVQHNFHGSALGESLSAFGAQEARSKVRPPVHWGLSPTILHFPDERFDTIVAMASDMHRRQGGEPTHGR
ncbi:hypothetical protein PG990_001713 [Apiospora arundinis]